MKKTSIAVPLVALALAAGAGSAQARDFGPRPYVIFTTGKQWTIGGDLIEDHMTDISEKLRNDFGADIRSNSWNCYPDGAHEFDRGCPTNDASFLADLGNDLDNVVPRGRPVILIAHSYGGDSLLKAVNGATDISRKVSRPLAALIVLDPTSTAGERKTRYGFYARVPGSVGLFYNRWQQNSPVPFNFGVSGFLDRGCAAEKCDESEQKFERNADGSTIDDACGWRWRTSFPGGFTWGCDARKSNHGSLVDDRQIQKQIIDGVTSRLDARRIVTLKNGFNGKFLVTEGGGGAGSVVNANRSQALDWEHLEITDLNGGALNHGDSITLATDNGFFVSVEADGRVVADRPQAFEWETFRVYKYSYNGQNSPTILPGDSIWLTAWTSRAVTLAGDNLSITTTPGCSPTARCLFMVEGRTR